VSEMSERNVGQSLPQFMHDIMGFEPLDNTVDDVSRSDQ